VEHFIDLFNARHVRPTPVITGIEEEALETMRRYEWPGNVRELANAIESAFTFGRSPPICLADLPPALKGNPAARLRPTSLADPIGTFADSEHTIIQRELDFTEGNKVQVGETAKNLAQEAVREDRQVSNRACAGG
jgi:DNA-binding NtrC family response regulator